MSALVQIYMKKIQNGSMSLEDVPPRWRREVEAALNNKSIDE